jgi:hypothetical protein
MRRKIEKYIAKKQGVDESNIRYTDDGRFDFAGDIDGVLAAVRGKEGSRRGKSTGKRNKPRKKNETIHHAHVPSMGHFPSMHHHPAMIHSGMYFSHMSPYMHHPGMQFMGGMPPHPGARNMPPAHAPPPLSQRVNRIHGTAAAAGKENVSANIPTPGNVPAATPFPMHPAVAQPNAIPSVMGPTAPGFFSFSPTVLEQKGQQEQLESETSAMAAGGPNGMSPFFGMSATPHSTRKTPFSDADLASSYFSSGRKSFFDSPKRHSSPSDLDMRGMTPLSNLRDTFANTPFTGETMKLSSPAMYNYELNKTLFGDDHNALSDIKRRFIMKTPKARSPKQISFRIGSGGSDDDPQLSHVSISPIANLSGGGKQRLDGGGAAADLPPSAGSLAKVSLASAEKPNLVLSTSCLKRKAPSTSVNGQQMPPPVTVSFSDSRDESALLSSTTKSGLKSYSPMEQRRDDHPTPRNVTLDESQMSTSITQSPFTMGGMPTPSRDSSFWRTQFGFSPANNSFTPFKSPAPFAGGDKECHSSLSNAASGESFVSSMCLTEHKSPASKRRKVSEGPGAAEQ